MSAGALARRLNAPRARIDVTLEAPALQWSGWEKVGIGLFAPHAVHLV